MPASKVQLTGGHFQDSEGNLLEDGYLLMKLNQDELVTDVGQVCSGIEITIQLDASGDVVTSPAQSVWGNDQMSPINSYYRVKGYKANGQLAWGPNNQQVIGDGGTFDVGTWTPNTVLSWFPTLQELELQVNGVDNAVQTLFDLEDSDTVTFEDLGGGQVTAHASGSSVPTLIESYNVLGNLKGWFANWDTAATSFLGTDLSSTIGTVSKIDPTATEGPAIQKVSQAIPNGQGCFFTNIGGISIGGLKYWTSRHRILSNGAGILWYAGMNDVPPSSTLNPTTPTTQNFVSFRWVSGDTNWSCVTCDGGGTATIVDSGVPVDTAFHTFTITHTPGHILFIIDGVQVADVTTHIPSGATPLAPFIGIQANAVAIQHQYSWWSFGA
jgi:hypothetical protein